MSTLVLPCGRRQTPRIDPPQDFSKKEKNETLELAE
jgi:hypothetical protein